MSQSKYEKRIRSLLKDRNIVWYNETDRFIEFYYVGPAIGDPMMSLKEMLKVSKLLKTSDVETSGWYEYEANTCPCSQREFDSYRGYVVANFTSTPTKKAKKS